MSSLTWRTDIFTLEQVLVKFLFGNMITPKSSYMSSKGISKKLPV